jgi:hypothetical protein
MAVEPAKDFEDVRSYILEQNDELELVHAQTECCFMWASKDGWPLGVIVNFIYRSGRFWLTATESRPRVKAVRRDPRVAIAITSKGSSVLHRQSLTYKCRATVHDDSQTLEWFIPEFAAAMRPGEPEKAAAFAEFLDSPGRVVFELAPEVRIGFDSSKMWKAAPSARPTDAPDD